VLRLFDSTNNRSSIVEIICKIPEAENIHSEPIVIKTDAINRSEINPKKDLLSMVTGRSSDTFPKEIVMKGLVSRIVITLLVCASLSVLVFAEGKGKKVTLPYDVVVNGTVIKKGEYIAVYNEQNSELVLLKGKEVVVKTKAFLKDNPDKAHYNEVMTSGKNDDKVLRSIRFAGESKSITVNNGEAETAAPQQ